MCTNAARRIFIYPEHTRIRRVRVNPKRWRFTLFTACNSHLELDDARVVEVAP